MLRRGGAVGYGGGVSWNRWLPLLLGARMSAPDAVVQRLLTSIDRDGNGTIDAAEYAGVDEVGSFADLDTDGDGAATVTELAQWIRVTNPRPNTNGARPALAVLQGARPAPVVAGPSARAASPEAVAADPSARAASPERVAAEPPEGPRAGLLAAGAGVLLAALGAGAWAGRRGRRRR